MEFVLVAPLYLMLLGGLFMVGGLMLNRLRMHVGDHLVTWVGGSRFCPMDEDGNPSGEKVEELTLQLFRIPIGGPLVNEQGFDVKKVDEDPAKINDFMALFFGGIKRLPLDVPSWIRGMLGLHGVMMHEGDNEWFLMETSEYNAGYDRSFSFHRLPMGDDSNRSSTVSSADLVTAGYLEAVLQEGWIGKETTSTVNETTSDEKQEFPKGRQLGWFAE